ncbi:MAG TPA: hypothetical protein VGG28_20670 [Kofleriaceae bacterium]
MFLVDARRQGVVSDRYENVIADAKVEFGPELVPNAHDAAVVGVELRSPRN